MADVLCDNPITLRGCILYEFLKGRKPFKTYQQLMKRLGDEFMNYPEFEFWYMRFARGNFDLDYDFSLEPKKRQITNLPVEIFEKVGDSLDFKDRNRLRNVSKDIRLLVDNWNPKVTEITYHRFDFCSIKQNSETYEVYPSTCSSDPLPAVVRMLKNPKLRLKKLTVSRDAKWKIIEEKLRKSPTKLHVNHLIVRNRNGTIDLSLLAPESLEEVSLFINDKFVKKFNEILQSEHYKQLKMLTISPSLSPSEFPFEMFIGFPRFTIKIHPNHSQLKVVEFIKKLVKCTQLEFCKLDYVYTPTWESIGEDLRQRGTLVPDSPNTRRYPIQGSTDFYEINIRKNSVSIERKS